jgi:hypothetical protein
LRPEKDVDAFLRPENYHELELSRFHSTKLLEEIF